MTESVLILTREIGLKDGQKVFKLVVVEYVVKTTRVTNTLGSVLIAHISHRIKQMIKSFT